MTVFRPLPLMTAALGPALALLIGLGVWQLGRADDKRARITAYEASAARQAWPDLITPMCRVRSSPVGHAVRSDAVAPRGPELRFYGARAGGPPGWRVLRLAPFPECACDPAQAANVSCAAPDRFLAVEVDFEPLRGPRLGPPEALVIDDAPRTNAFTPPNTPDAGEFHRFEPDELAAAFGLTDVQTLEPLWLIARDDGLPPALAATPPARHIGYALTWFGLAAALLGVYLAYHVGTGRLGWRAR